jgi:hypothetical protein
MLLALSYNLTVCQHYNYSNTPCWVPNTLFNSSTPSTQLVNATSGFNDVICSAIYPGNNTTTAPNAPWFFTFLYYLIFASALIFALHTSGKFIRFAQVSFGMIFVAIPFVHYSCDIGGQIITLMPADNIVVPLVVFILSLIAAVIWG